MANSISAHINLVTNKFTNLSKKSWLLAVASLVLFSTGASGFIKQSTEGLEAIGTPHFDSLKVAEDAVIPVSRKVYISDIKANFARDWMNTYRSDTTKHYRNKVLNDYSKALKAHLVDRLTLSGWDVVDTYENGALIVNAQIKDLFITGPEKLTREHVLVRNIGQSSIVINVEGANKQTMFEIEDRRDAGGLDSVFIETDNAMNYSWFSQLMKDWAGKFVIYLDMSTNKENS